MNIAHSGLQVSDIRDRWQQCIGRCHGHTAVAVGVPAAWLAPPISRWQVVTLHWPEPQPLASGVLSDPCAWPFRPTSIDAVWMHIAQPNDLLCRTLMQADISLNASGYGVFVVRQPALRQWTQIGMPWLSRCGWQLLSQDWGDHRRVPYLPAAGWALWTAAWQRYLPLAQWSVQLWQKRTLRALGSSSSVWQYAPWTPSGAMALPRTWPAQHSEKK